MGRERSEESPSGRVDLEVRSTDASEIIMKSLDRQMALIVARLMERGFELPFNATLVGSAGKVLMIRYESSEEGFKAFILAEDARGTGLELPVTVTIKDARGKAAAVVIRSREGEPEFLS